MYITTKLLPKEADLRASIASTRSSAAMKQKSQKTRHWMRSNAQLPNQNFDIGTNSKPKNLMINRLHCFQFQACKHALGSINNSQRVKAPKAIPVWLAEPASLKTTNLISQPGHQNAGWGQFSGMLTCSFVKPHRSNQPHIQSMPQIGNHLFSRSFIGLVSRSSVSNPTRSTRWAFA